MRVILAFVLALVTTIIFVGEPYKAEPQLKQMYKGRPPLHHCQRQIGIYSWVASLKSGLSQKIQ